MYSVTEQGDHAGWRVLVVGTGGQGVLTAARLLCQGLVGLGHSVVSGQLHGMAQRGGSVQSCVLIDCGISPVIARGRADVVLGFEPVEAARALPFMSSRTAVYMNTAPVVPQVLAQRSILGQPGAEYPDVERLVEAARSVTPRVFAFDATRSAIEAGSAQALNMILLGCLLGARCLSCTPDEFWKAVAGRMPPALVQVNDRAFSAGVELGTKLQPAGANL